MPTETATEVSSHPPSAPPGKGLLINRNFALLSIGQAISNIGDFVYSTTLLVWVYTITHSAAAVSGVLIAQYTPIFLLGPVAGVFVDRWNRRQTMIVSDIAQAMAAVLPLLAPLSFRLPSIYASVFLLSAFSRFFLPARAGVQQVIVAPEQQGQAASIGQATLAMAIIIGPAIATPLFFIVGPIIAVSINAASFIVSAVCLQAMRISKEALQPGLLSGKDEAKSGVGAMMKELLAGFRFVGKTRVLLMIVILILIAMIGAGALNALDVIFVTHNLHVGASLYGPLAGVSGIGMLIGAIGAGIAVRKLKPKYLLVGSVLLLGVGIIIYSFQTWYFAALIINFLLAIPNGGIDVGFAPLFLAVTPNTMIGRVQSVIETAVYAASLISIALAGYFGQFIPVSIIFAIGGASITLAGIFGWFTLPVEVPAQSSSSSM